MATPTDNERDRYAQSILEAQASTFDERVAKLEQSMVNSRNAPQPAPDGMKPPPVLTEEQRAQVHDQAVAKVRDNDQRYFQDKMSEYDQQKGADKTATQADAAAPGIDSKFMQPAGESSNKAEQTQPSSIAADFNKVAPPPPPPQPEEQQVRSKFM